jgi:hypothetical protein
MISVFSFQFFPRIENRWGKERPRTALRTALTLTLSPRRGNRRLQFLDFVHLRTDFGLQVREQKSSSMPCTQKFNSILHLFRRKRIDQP